MPDPTPASAPAAPGAPSITTPKVFSTSATDVSSAILRKAVVPKAAVAAFLASVDPGAPAGKTVRAIQCGFDAKGDLTLTITYNP